MSKPSDNVVKNKYFEKKNKTARITAKVKRVRGNMIESEEILDAKSLIQSLEESKGAWLELQNHIKSFHNLQECIDHFNELEGIESVP